MSATMLQLVQQVTSELGLNTPTQVIAGQQADALQVLALLNRAGRDLVKENEWQALQKEYRFYVQSITTTGTTVQNSAVITGIPSTTGLTPGEWTLTGTPFSQDTQIVSVDSDTQVTINQVATTSVSAGTILFSKTKYNLPLDFDSITSFTQWDKSKHWQMLGPETPQQWQWLKSGFISTGPRVRWRMLGKQFQIWPQFSTPEYLGFEYKSNYFVQAFDGKEKGFFTLDTDTSVFDDDLLVLLTKLKYFQVKGFDTTALMQNYMRVLSIAKAVDKGSETLSFAPYPAKVLIGVSNIPDSGYGT